MKNLSISKLVGEVIFKGGTSLSKGNQITNKIKETEKIVSHGLEYFQHPLEEKKGRNRRTFYHYAKAVKDENCGQVKDHIQLEINAFTQLGKGFAI